MTQMTSKGYRTYNGESQTMTVCPSARLPQKVHLSATVPTVSNGTKRLRLQRPAKKFGLRHASDHVANEVKVLKWNETLHSLPLNVRRLQVGLLLARENRLSFLLASFLHGCRSETIEHGYGVFASKVFCCRH